MTETKKARDTMIAAIRRGLGARGDEPGRRGTVRARLERSPDGMIPERARTPKDEQPDLLASMLKSTGTIVHILDRLDDVPGAVADQLAALNLPARARHGDDPVLAGLNWDDTVVERLNGPARGEDDVSLSRAAAAAAETGTLMFTSGPDNPSTLNFLPETHFVVLQAKDITGSYEESWNRFRATYGRGTLPRTVNLVSGPSATADIERTLVRGAHGPRRLAVFLVLDEQTSDEDERKDLS
ncbi:MAG: lactate utilization protein C [Rhodomicrobiaceae bacterium]